MTSLGDRIGKIMRGGGDELGWRDMFRQARDAAGSNRKLAKRMGISESTVRRALSGETKRSPLARTMAALRAAVMPASARRDSALELRTHDRDRHASRTLTAKNLRLNEGTMDRVADVWVSTGDQEAAAAELLRGVGDEWYRGYLTPPRSETTGETGEETGDEPDDYDAYDDDFDQSDEYDESPYDYEDYDAAFDGAEGYGGSVE